MAEPPIPDLIVLRHGETEWNLAGRWQGALDSPLTARGRAQARAMGAMFARLGLGRETHRLLVSPQGRAVTTADLVFGGAVEQDADLREIGVGDWTGRDRDAIRADPRLPPDPDLLTLYAAPPGGEGFAALERRCRRVLARLAGPTILVTHGITGRMIRTLAQGLPWQSLQDLPGGQGLAYRLRGGVETAMEPTPEDRDAA